MRMERILRSTALRARRPARKATNLSVDAALLAAARKHDINLSATLESALVEELLRRRRADWQATHREAIARYNESVERFGVYSDGLRRF